jgi:hypothetical protein
MIDRSLFLGPATLLALWAGCVPGLAIGDPASPSRGALTLAVPRPPATGESLLLRVEVGPLARGALLVVRTAGGTRVGSIAPFGARAREKGGFYTLPLPQKLVATGEIDLRFEIDQKGAKAVRPPTAKELLGVELVFVPITPPAR